MRVCPQDQIAVPNTDMYADNLLVCLARRARQCLEQVHQVGPVWAPVGAFCIALSFCVLFEFEKATQTPSGPDIPPLAGVSSSFVATAWFVDDGPPSHVAACITLGLAAGDATAPTNTSYQDLGEPARSHSYCMHSRFRHTEQDLSSGC